MEMPQSPPEGRASGYITTHLTKMFWKALESRIGAEEIFTVIWR
jgi:hypothetical protein